MRNHRGRCWSRYVENLWTRVYLLGKTRLVFEVQVAAQKHNLKVFTATGSFL